jgi:DNA-binding NarL/FixJ family response regulator
VASLAGTVTPIRVLIVDDDALVRAGLSMILAATDDVRVVAEVADGSDVLPAVDALRPRRRAHGHPDAADGRPRRHGSVVRARRGARDHRADDLRRGRPRPARAAVRRERVLLKDTPAADIVQAIRLVAAGEAMLSPAVTRRLIGHVAETGMSARRDQARELLARLTEREREVAEAIGRGASNAEIAEELFMSVATVKAHVTRLLTKLEVANRVQIALLAHDASD